MTVPKPFQWPTPWLWGAIALISLIEANGFFDAVIHLCALTIVASVIHFFRGSVGGLRRTESVSEPKESDGGLGARLTEIERRLTDTQDVMIALSEKVDRWDEERKQMESAP